VQQQCAATASTLMDLQGPEVPSWPAKMTRIDPPATSSHRGGQSIRDRAAMAMRTGSLSPSREDLAAQASHD
jgi:hypothetical protein